LTRESGWEQLLACVCLAEFLVSSETAGVCHVVATFSTGYTFSTDITFEQRPSDPPGCCPPTGPVSSSNGLTIRVPTGMCLVPDAGVGDAATE
jgi:hypothetical protein